MTTFDLPEPELVSVRLDPAQRVTLGGGVAAEAEEQRIWLGQPVCLPADLDHVDEDAKPFLMGRPDSTFTLLAVTVSFAHDEDNPLKSAWVDITLRRQSPPDMPEPLAWSMVPFDDSDPVNVTKKAVFNGSLKLESPALGLDVGPSMERENDRTYTQRAVSVEALREGKSTPRWQFSETDVSPIRGTHRLTLIVDTARGAFGRAEISAGATIWLRRRKVFRYEAALDKVPEVAFAVVPPPSAPVAQAEPSGPGS
jgi:hypothetical protein